MDDQLDEEGAEDDQLADAPNIVNNKKLRWVGTPTETIFFSTRESDVLKEKIYQERLLQYKNDQGRRPRKGK